jgi:Myb-like DNA-binding domain
MVNTHACGLFYKLSLTSFSQVAMEMPIVLSRAQCAARYSTLKAPKATGKWTPEEDEQLQKLADEIPETTKNRWGLISGRMASRTGRQCRNQWVNIFVFHYKF